MTEVFKDMCLTEKGFGLIWLWMRTFLDISISAPGEHMTILWSDLRYGARMLLKNYTFTAVAVIALALGIGANSAIFSVVNALVLRPLAFPDLDRLVAVYNSRPENGVFRLNVAPADFVDWKKQSAVFEKIGYYNWADISITGTGDPERVQGFLVSANFFDILGSAAGSGRTFLADEDQPGQERAVVLSHGLWLRRFGGDPGLIGKPVTLNGRDHLVVGIMPEEFNYPAMADLWVPLPMGNDLAKERAIGSLIPVAKLKPGISVSQAQAEMALVAGRLEQQYPQTNSGRKVNLISLRADAAGEYTPEFSFALLGASIFVLLIACANIANLQLARATARQKEMAIRAAMGASRSRVIRQLLTENVLLSLVGAAAGLPVAVAVIRYVKVSVPPSVSKNVAGWRLIGLDTNVLIFTMAVAVIAGILFGLAPAKQASKPDLTSGLKEGGRSSTVGAGHGRLRSILVVSEVALSLILLCSVGLMITGFNNIVTGCYQGIDSNNVLTLRLAPRPSEYKTRPQVASFYKRSIDRIETLPGVQSAGAIGNLPSTGWSTTPFTIEGAPLPQNGREPVSDYLAASGGYFPSLRIPLLRGRLFTDQDDHDTQPVALISETMLRRFFPDEDPLGKRVKLGPVGSSQPWLTIVGVVGDTKSFYFDKEPRSIIYQSDMQSPWSRLYLTVRTQGDPKSAVTAIKEQIYELDRDQPISEIKTLDEAINDNISGIRLAAGLMAFFGIIALVLSAAGVYGVMSYTVTQRIHEIGVRMALGAERGSVLRLIVRQGLSMVAIGLGIGIPAAFALNRFLTSVLFSGAKFGASTFVGITVVLVMAATFSSYLPARRATTVDPISALRSE
jgi:putative ABC transport system permease protein